MQFETRKVSVKDLARNTGQIPGVPKNPRIIKDSNFQKLKASIEEDPEMLELREIVAYNHNGKLVIIGGNMRFEALKALGIEQTTVKVITGDVDTEQLKRIILKDNSAFGQWDFDILANEFDEAMIAAAAIEIPDFDEPKTEEEAEEDNFTEADEEKAEPITKAGDIWQLGDHRLMCGDSTKAEQIARLMDGEKADLWITDPPYNVDYGEKNKILNKCVKGKRIQTKIENDKMSEAQFLQFLTDAFKVAYGVMKPGAAFYIWHCSKEQMNFETALNNAQLVCRQQIIWNKNNIVLGMQDYQFKHEPCFYGWKDGAAHYFISRRDQTTVQSDSEELDFDKMKASEMRELLKQIYSENEIPTTIMNEKKPQRSADHPTTKPVKLFGRQIRNSSRPGAVVLDTFGGSGTTIVAAEQLRRKARLMELTPHYCDVIVARWEKLTGKQAKLITNIFNEEEKKNG